MLIDADLRCPQVGPALGAETGAIWSTCWNAPARWRMPFRVNEKSGLHYLTSRSSVENPQSVLSGVAFQQLKSRPVPQL